LCGWSGRAAEAADQDLIETALEEEMTGHLGYEKHDQADQGAGSGVAGQRVAGRVLPVRHYGSVDVFLEALGRAEAGDVLVVDNGGRLDEA
jgi:regulator of RNase E activity RraA